MNDSQAEVRSSNPDNFSRDIDNSNMFIDIKKELVDSEHCSEEQIEQVHQLGAGKQHSLIPKNKQSFTFNRGITSGSPSQKLQTPIIQNNEKLEEAITPSFTQTEQTQSILPVQVDKLVRDSTQTALNDKVNKRKILTELLVLKTETEYKKKEEEILQKKTIMRAERVNHAVHNPQARLYNNMKRDEKHYQSNRTNKQQLQVDDRVTQIINSVSYDTLLSIKKAVQERENISVDEEEAQAQVDMNSASMKPHGGDSPQKSALGKSITSQNFSRDLNESEVQQQDDIMFNLNLRSRKLSNVKEKPAKEFGAERFAIQDFKANSLSEIQFKGLSKTLKNEAKRQDVDAFMATGKMNPSMWIDDDRQMKVDLADPSDLDLVKFSYNKEKNNEEQDKFKSIKNNSSNMVVVNAQKLFGSQLRHASSLELGQFQMNTQQLELTKLSQEILAQNKLLAPIDKNEDQKQLIELMESESSISAVPDSEHDTSEQKSQTMTNELISARFDVNQSQASEEMQLYDQIVEERNNKLTTSILRFVDNKQSYFTQRAKGSLCKCRMFKSKKIKHTCQYIEFSRMSAECKRERIKYLWFRLKCIAQAYLFIMTLKRIQKESFERRQSKLRLTVLIDEEDSQIQEKEDRKQQLSRCAMMIWYCLLSIGLWFNMVSTPFLILFPEMNSEIKNPNLYYLLWLNELLWLLDILRKTFTQQKKSRASDIYENAVAYFKSTLIIDVISLLPQLVTGLDNRFAPLKLLRLYQISHLHYLVEAFIYFFFNDKDKRQLYVVVYASQTICRIFMLLHYLAIVWMYIGSESFIGYEEGYDPWQTSIEDFNDYTVYRLYIFSVYWVCTVVTTVGYGDYAGQTTLEFSYSIFLEFFGLVVFSMLQVAVQQVVNHDASYANFVLSVDNRIAVWLSELEISNFPLSLPEDLYYQVKQDLWRSFRRDHSMVTEDFQFYNQLSPKLQEELTQLLFGKFMTDFNDLFERCEPQFINNLIVMLKFNCYKHGQILQSPMYQCQELFFIHTGGIAVCESSSFGEPILIYGKGAVINLYPIIMEQKLDFKFVAISENSFTVNKENKVIVNYDELTTETFVSERANLRNNMKEQDQFGECNEIELYSISSDQVQNLCNTFPDTAAQLQVYAIEQIEHLSRVRCKKQHLHPANFKTQFYRKNELFFDRKADVNSSMKINVQTLNNLQRQSAIEQIVNMICERVNQIEQTIYTHMQVLLYKTISLKQRQKRRMLHDRLGYLKSPNSSYSIKTSESLMSSSSNSENKDIIKKTRNQFKVCNYCGDNCDHEKVIKQEQNVLMKAIKKKKSKRKINFVQKNNSSSSLINKMRQTARQQAIDTSLKKLIVRSEPNYIDRQLKASSESFLDRKPARVRLHRKTSGIEQDDSSFINLKTPPQTVIFNKNARTKNAERVILPYIKQMNQINTSSLSRHDGTESSPLESPHTFAKIEEQEEALCIFKNSYREIADHEFNSMLEVNERSGEPSETRTSQANSAQNRAESLNQKRNCKKAARDNRSHSLGQLKLNLNFYSNSNSQDIVIQNSVQTASFASEHPDSVEGVHKFQSEKKSKKGKFKYKSKTNEIVPGIPIDSVSSSHESQKSSLGCVKASKHYSNFKF